MEGPSTTRQILVPSHRYDRVVCRGVGVIDEMDSQRSTNDSVDRRAACSDANMQSPDVKGARARPDQAVKLVESRAG